MNVPKMCVSVCLCFAHAHLLGVSEGLEHGRKGLLHLASLKHKFEWKEYPILLLKLIEGDLTVTCTPAQSRATAHKIWAQVKCRLMSVVKGAEGVRSGHVQVYGPGPAS